MLVWLLFNLSRKKASFLLTHGKQIGKTVYECEEKQKTQSVLSVAQDTLKSHKKTRGRYSSVRGQKKIDQHASTHRMRNITVFCFGYFCFLRKRLSESRFPKRSQGKFQRKFVAEKVTFEEN